MLAALPAAEARKDIRTSKQLLEDLLGEEVTHFSYPYGMRRHFTENLRGFCRDIGFHTIANAIPGMQFVARRATGSSGPHGGWTRRGRQSRQLARRRPPV